MEWVTELFKYHNSDNSFEKNILASEYLVNQVNELSLRIKHLESENKELHERRNRFSDELDKYKMISNTHNIKDLYMIIDILLPDLQESITKEISAFIEFGKYENLCKITSDYGIRDKVLMLKIY